VDIILPSTKELLGVVLGEQTAEQLFRGSLIDLFREEALPQEPRDRLGAARELVKRWMVEELERGPTLDGRGVTVDFLRIHFWKMEREVFVALFLDVKYRLLAVEDMFFGTFNMARVHPREVVKRALALNAGAVIIAHNHPSGVAEPSQADELITRHIREALKLVEISLLDHVIIGSGSSFVSFAERGLL